jgi:hypothetical protein
MMQRLGIEASAAARLLEVAFVDNVFVLDTGLARLLEVAFVDDPLVLESGAGHRQPGAKQGRGIAVGKMRGWGILRLR